MKAECQKRDSKRPYKALTNTSLSIEQSKFLFENDDTLIPVGSGMLKLHNFYAFVLHEPQFLRNHV